MLKQFNGEIRRLNTLNGKVKRKPLGLKIDFSHIANFGRTEIKPLNNYHVKWYIGRPFSGAIKLINALFRFFIVNGRLTINRESKAISAPTIAVETDSTIRASKSAPPSAHVTEEIATHKKERVSVSVILSAYIRAGCKYVEKLFFKKTARLDVAPGSAISYRENMTLDRTSEAIAAISKIIKGLSKITHDYKATGRFAPVEIVPDKKSTVVAEHAAPINSGAVAPINIDSDFKLGYSAPLATWFLPEQDGDRLSLYQVFSGVQSGKILEIDLESTSVYWANATVKDGTLNLVFAETVTPDNSILEVV